MSVKHEHTARPTHPSRSERHSRSFAGLGVEAAGCEHGAGVGTRGRPVSQGNRQNLFARFGRSRAGGSSSQSGMIGGAAPSSSAIRSTNFRRRVGTGEVSRARLCRSRSPISSQIARQCLGSQAWIRSGPRGGRGFAMAATVSLVHILPACARLCLPPPFVTQSDFPWFGGTENFLT